MTGFPKIDLVARFSLDGTLVPNQTEAKGRTALPRRPAPVHSRSNRVGPRFRRRAFLDAGDVAGFGFFDKFTLSAWIKANGSQRGTILSRMLDQPEAEGYSVVLDQGKIQVNLVKRWLDDAIRVETAAVVPDEKWTHIAVTYDGSRVAAGVKVYVDGKLAPINVLLDELNQTFQTKEPLRIGAGGGLGSRFVGAIDEPSVHAAALDAGDIQVLATKESITEILRIPSARRTEGQARKLRELFPGDRCSGLGPRAARTNPLVADGDRRAGREHPHDDGHGGAADPARDPCPVPRPVRPARASGRAWNPGLSFLGHGTGEAETG